MYTSLEWHVWQEILAALLWSNKFSKTIIGFKRLIHSTLIKKRNKRRERVGKRRKGKERRQGDVKLIKC